jgi:hypothetical protein
MFSRSKKSRSEGSPATPEPRDPTRLPKGAEAALWSIIESMPDPRNHLALTRDPTAEVRLSRRQIDEAMALAPWVPPAGIVIVPEAVEAVEPAPMPRRDGIRWSTDTAEVRLPTAAPVHPLERFAEAEPRRYARGA